MKALVLSDLHFELRPEKMDKFFRKLRTPADVLILAGDVCGGWQLPSVMRRFCAQYRDVVYVHGNHEFYRHTREEVLAFTATACAENRNLHWLDCSEAEVGGVRFVGATMWFRDAFSAPRDYLNDFERIRGDFRGWVGRENVRAVEYLRAATRPGDVVVTHHLPSWRSIKDRYLGDFGNWYYVCDMEDVMAESAPRLWAHGHTHSSHDYVLGETRVYCNPRGYGNENARDFSDERTIEI